MTQTPVSPAQLAAKLDPKHLRCMCTPKVVCGEHKADYPDGPPRCRANCGEPLDPILWPVGLHMGCDEPAPIPAAPTPLFSAPAGPAAAHPLKANLMRIIRWFEDNSARSQQAEIGPSEVGQDCLRRIAYRLTGTAAANDTADPWFAIVGTAVHDWLAAAIQSWQVISLGRKGDQKRYFIEERLQIADDLVGNCDLFDVDEGRVIDHKVVGATALKKYIEQGPSSVYRTQVHLYGRGWQLRGYQVRDVTIAFYPRSNYLDGMHVWSEPYDEQIAIEALNRLATVRQLAASLPADMIPATPDPAGCAWCPFYRPGGPADQSGCPGPLKTPGA